MNSLLHEISTSRYFLMQPAAFGLFRSNVLNFLNSGEAVHGKRDAGRRSVARFEADQLVTDCHRLTNFRAYDDEWDEDGTDEPLDADVKYINILRLTGPMTRGGGECSYGSIEMRDQLMAAADRDDVIGHIIYCRTPGGMATTLIDFRKAIDYIHERGQKIYMFCDGTVASGGAFLSAMCDGVFAFNEEDEIGSIGMYSAFFALANGAKNAITQETYVEVYADKSTEKNKTMRDGAEGNTDAILKETNEYLDELLADMKRDRPSINEEQMNGAMFKMKDVLGSIIDGICTLPELCEMIYKEWALSDNGNKNSAGEPDDTQTAKSINPIKTTDMSKEYQNLATLAGYEAEVKMVSDNEGLLTLQPEEADAMESKLGELTASVETLTADNAQLRERETALNASLATMTIERDEARKKAEELAAVAAESDETKVNAVREEMQAQIDNLVTEKATLEEANKKAEIDFAELREAKEGLEAAAQAAAEEATRTIAEKDQLISDLQAQLAEAQSGIDSKVNAGESPKTNGETAGLSHMTSAPAWDPTKSPSENAEAMKVYLDEQAKKVR